MTSDKLYHVIPTPWEEKKRYAFMQSEMYLNIVNSTKIIKQAEMYNPNSEYEKHKKKRK